MVFAHDTELALGSAAALVNTAAGPDPSAERLPDVAALDAFCATWHWSGRRDSDEAELDAVRALRPVLAELWHCDEDRAVGIVNGLLAEHHALPQLLRHGTWDYHLHASPQNAPLASRMAVEAAMAMIDVIRMKELDRLHVCAMADCGDVFLDLSKNRSRRYCDGTCLNRANVAAYRSRRRVADAGRKQKA